MKMEKKHIFFVVSALFCLSLPFGVSADNFDPNHIMSDEELLDSSAMTLTEIQNFLVAKGGYLANYKTLDADGILRSASEIIYNAAANNYDCDGVDLSATPTILEKKQKCPKISINPKFLLALLQKEQSLITDPSPTQKQLDWAVGYGCFDGLACNLRWQGFGKQVNSASLQFYDYIKNPNHYTYQAGNTYQVSNTGKPDSLITPRNNATAALYNYTPHVYNGNYNFYKLWNSYFTKNFLNGSLVQIKGEIGVWLIKDGEKHPFVSKGALTSRFDMNKIITVNKSDLDLYPKGSPIKFPQYSIVRAPSGAIYLLVDDKRRGFVNSEAFRNIGYNPEEILDASWEDIISYKEVEPITASSTYITGALLQNKKTGGIYWVENGTKSPLWDSVLLKTKYKNKRISSADPAKLDSYKTIEPVKFGEGELLKSNDSSAVYVIEQGKKRPFTSGKVFEDLGYKWINVITVSPKIINLYENGEPVIDAYNTNTVDADSVI